MQLGKQKLFNILAKSNGVMVLEAKRLKKPKQSHSSNLEIVLKELRQNKDQGGAHLNDLALQCGVSIRQIYRYFNELQNMGYEIMKVPNSNNPGKYIIKDMEPNQNVDLTLINMMNDLERIKKEVQSAKLFINELLVRYWMIKLGIIIPLATPIYKVEYEDAITSSHQMFVYSNITEENWEYIHIKVSPKVVNTVVKSLSSEITSQKRLRDGWFTVTLRTKRIREITGLLTQWGSEVEVIEPGWLKHKMLENCKAILHASRLRKVVRNDLAGSNY